MQGKELQSSNSVSFRFAELEQLFWIVHGWHDQDRPRFQASMKQFRRNGIPTGDLSRGPGSQYDLEAVFQLALVQALDDQQMPIISACTIVGAYWPDVLRPAILQGWDMLRRGEDTALLAFIFQTSFEGWSKSRTQEAWDWLGKDLDAYELRSPLPLLLVDKASSPRFADFYSPKATEPLSFGLHHASVINLSKLIHGIIEVLVRLDFAQHADIERWFEDRLEAIGKESRAM